VVGIKFVVFQELLRENTERREKLLVDLKGFQKKTKRANQTNLVKKKKLYKEVTRKKTEKRETCFLFSSSSSSCINIPLCLALEGYFGEREYNFFFHAGERDPKGFFIRPLLPSPSRSK